MGDESGRGAEAAGSAGSPHPAPSWRENSPGALGQVAPFPVATAAPSWRAAARARRRPAELFYDLAVVVLVAQAAYRLPGISHGLGLASSPWCSRWSGSRGPMAPCITSCTATRTPGRVVPSCSKSWCSSRSAPSFRRRAAHAEQRSPLPPVCCSRCWRCLGGWLHVATAPHPATPPRRPRSPSPMRGRLRIAGRPAGQR
jgi:hypothetical protein